MDNELSHEMLRRFEAIDRRLTVLEDMINPQQDEEEITLEDEEEPV